MIGESPRLRGPLRDRDLRAADATKVGRKKQPQGIESVACQATTRSEDHHEDWDAAVNDQNDPGKVRRPNSNYETVMMFVEIPPEVNSGLHTHPGFDVAGDQTTRVVARTASHRPRSEGGQGNREGDRSVYRRKG